MHVTLKIKCGKCENCENCLFKWKKSLKFIDRLETCLLFSV